MLVELIIEGFVDVTMSSMIVVSKPVEVEVETLGCIVSIFNVEGRVMIVGLKVVISWTC